MDSRVDFIERNLLESMFWKRCKIARTRFTDFRQFSECSSRSQRLPFRPLYFINERDSQPKGSVKCIRNSNGRFEISNEIRHEWVRFLEIFNISNE